RNVLHAGDIIDDDMRPTNAGAEHVLLAMDIYLPLGHLLELREGGAFDRVDGASKRTSIA
ncbi:hypothetical protein K2Z83_11730, partial [Oscillochloris sp. ZM17-4]|uniref:hypothetical protein n=1 Tax=Oscillochloris sp. ZM17-4 TaxID=2866714 RepID=UPI001C7359CF